MHGKANHVICSNSTIFFDTVLPLLSSPYGVSKRLRSTLSSSFLSYPCRFSVKPVKHLKAVRIHYQLHPRAKDSPRPGFHMTSQRTHIAVICDEDYIVVLLSICQPNRRSHYAIVSWTGKSSTFMNRLNILTAELRVNPPMQCLSVSQIVERSRCLLGCTGFFKSVLSFRPSSSRTTAVGTITHYVLA